MFKYMVTLFVATAIALMFAPVYGSPKQHIGFSHTRSDIPNWVTRQCASKHSVNCRHDNAPDVSIVRQIPNGNGMVCVFYVRQTAEHSDYCS